MESINIKPKNEVNTELKKLQELIKNNPSVLEKGPQVTINKIYTDKNGISRDYSDSSDESSSDDEQYVSTKDITNDKLDNTIRYLKLDLNNEQLKSSDLEDKIKELNTQIKTYENNMNFVKECLQFLNSNHQFKNNISLHNITEYNDMIIESARAFFKIKREFEKINSYTNIDETIRSNYDILVIKKFNDIKESYNKVNNSLKSIDNTMKFMKGLLYFLAIMNLFTLIYNWL